MKPIFLIRLKLFWRRHFHRHTFVMKEMYDFPSIVHLPVWGKRLESIVLKCTKCGKTLDYPVSGSLFQIDWKGTKIAERAHRGKITKRLAIGA